MPVPCFCALLLMPTAGVLQSAQGKSAKLCIVSMHTCMCFLLCWRLCAVSELLLLLRVCLCFGANLGGRPVGVCGCVSAILSRVLCLLCFLWVLLIDR
jgi:hypothetical protein